MIPKNRSIRLSHRDILFEDENYIVCNKQRGWPVHQTLDKSRPSLEKALAKFIKHRDGLERDPYIALHHRLDVDTSGVVIFAKTKTANPILSKVFSEREATKKYVAVVLGDFPKESGVIEHFLAPKKTRVRGKQIEKMESVRSGGKKAITKYEFLEQNDKYSLVELTLVTGRKHQIRAQLALMGFPILGDNLYGDQVANGKEGVAGQLLHARSITFYDSLSDESITAQAPVPEDISSAMSGVSKSGEQKKYIAFNKPYGVLCQFTGTEDERTLAEFNLPKGVYPAGRLDKDSEGLLILSNDGKFIDRLINPKHDKAKTYWVQVERVPTSEKLRELSRGVKIKDYRTKPCKVRIIEPKIEERDPPVRFRKSVPTCWLEITISEGKNRQVRRMTANIGHPTLRLIRVSMEGFKIEGLEIGEWKEVSR